MRLTRATVVGLLGLGVLLSGATVLLGLTALAAATGAAAGVATCALLDHALVRRAGAVAGPADLVTLGRALLAAVVAALVVDSLSRPATTGTTTTAVVALSVVALVLDGVDGAVARRTGTASSLGARFDGEVDAFLMLVLSVAVAASYGAWVLAIGAARYLFLVAGWVLPWMRGTLPPRYWRKVVTATEGIVLTVAVAGVLPPPLTALALLVALALLAESFGRDVLWLWHRRHGAVIDLRSVAATGVGGHDRAELGATLEQA